MGEEMKKVLKFILFLLPWLISGLLFKVDFKYYNMLNLPSFVLPSKLIGIIWFIIYLLITISLYKISKTEKIVGNNDLFYVLITNYLANQLFLYGFFNLKSPFLGFILTTITMVSSIFLFLEIKKLNKNASYYLIPYIIYSIYALILSLSIYIMNF